MRARHARFLALAAAVCISSAAFAQTTPPTSGPVKITLDDAIQMALQHNHNLLAQRTVVLQNQAEEITANLRPNPVLQGDAQFLPIFQPDKFSADYINTTAQFDVGLSYLFERGRKRQHRLQAARDVTEQSRFIVTDNERSLVFLVASQYIDVQVAESTIDLAAQDLKSFQNTVDISESRYKAGDISEVDFLKIKIQLLQFQTDMSQAQLAKVQALASLRQSLGYESVPADYDVASPFDYAPVTMKLEDLQAKALADRPDLRAARQGIAAANSQYELQKAIGKVDPTGTAVYSHVSNAYEGVRTNDQIVTLYRSGYLKEAQDSRDISEYAYKRGAASLLDYLDAERSYRATELAYRQALASYLTAVEQLREAVGTRTLP